MGAVICLLYAENIHRDMDYLTTHVERKYICFANANPDTFTSFFRFRQSDMIRILNNLRIPAYFKLDNGIWVNDQEELLVMLRFLASNEFFGINIIIMVMILMTNFLVI